jgi:hypothetical protein
VNRRFGPFWDAPIARDATPVATPVGAICSLCEEPIAHGDQGIVTPLIYLDEHGKPRSRPAPQHRGCLLLGTVGHMAGTCFCHEGLGSIRERGLATIAWAEANHG